LSHRTETCRLCTETAPATALIFYELHRYAHPACLWRARGDRGIALLTSGQIERLRGVGLAAVGLDDAKLEAMRRDALRREQGARA
jgi:hypothetical protein